MTVKPGKIYVIGQQGSGLVKIGRTTNLTHRLASIQTACPTKVEVLWHAEGGSALERGLHLEFRALRTYGEWFDFGDGDPIAAVSEAATRVANPTRRQGHAPIRNLRASDDVWNAALANARAEGRTLTSVILEFLDQYNAMTPQERGQLAMPAE